MYRGMANLERFRGCSHSAGHGPSDPFRHTGRMSSVTRFHLLGTFPVDPVETAHLQGSVEPERAVLSLCRRRGTAPFRRGDPPFFAALDKRPAYRGNKEQTLSAYRKLLAGTLNNGIHDSRDLKRFIEKEDAVFRAFLSGLHDSGSANMADITRDTEKCCSEVFLAAGRKEITYKEALIYMALRADRRLIQNVRTCLDDIHRGEVATPEQAHAYIWMILQPYASLDGLCMTLLSPEDKKALDRIATETPGAFETLRKILPSERNRLDELPGMLMEIFIASL